MWLLFFALIVVVVVVVVFVFVFVSYQISYYSVIKNLPSFIPLILCLILFSSSGHSRSQISLNPVVLILDDDNTKCWGVSGISIINDVGITQDKVYFGTGRTAKAIAAGYYTCVILDDNSVRCWGRNDKGQLGYDDTMNRYGVNVTSGPPVNLGAGRTAKAIDVGAYHTCVILDVKHRHCSFASTHLRIISRTRS